MTGLTLDLWINLTTADSYAVLLTIGEQSSADPVGTRHITRTESFVTGDGIRFSLHPSAAQGLHGAYNLTWHADDYVGPANPAVTSSACNR